MKQSILILFIALTFSTAKSQCEPPEIIDWAALPEWEWTYGITFYAPEAGSYTLTVEMDYGPAEGGSVSYQVEAETAGVNYAVMYLTDLYYNDEETYYFKCLLVRDCGQEVTGTTEFYMSNHSLLGGDDFECENLVMPFQEISEQPGNVVETILDFPTEDELVESFEVFVDIGHEHSADLSIELEHPSGLSISLLDFEWEEEGKMDFSVLFSDLGTETPQDFDNFMGPRGRYLPAEPLSTFNGLPTQGDWILRVTDNTENDNGVLYGVCLSITCSPNYRGHTYYDFNSNGLLDEDEVAFPFPSILNSIDGNELFGAVNGDFAECGETGSGTLEIQNVPNYFTSDPVNINLEQGDQFEEYLIPITATELVSDVAVDLISLEPNRPGFEATYLAQVSNVGTICEDDISVEIAFPDYVEIVSSPNADLVITGNTGSIDVAAVCPFDPLEVNLTILLDDTVSLGTILEATISANISDEDPNELNNSFISSVIVVGAYDPNDKQVSATTIGDEFLEDGAPLKYTIRFQNTGTFYAERVVIADTIDADLDINSLQIISTSHNMELSREGNVLYFEFDQIFLPDSATDFDGSIGHVRYEIDPLPTFSEGETIDNTAYIYFDFNEPIITNTVITEFGNPLSVSNEINFETRLFPNPADQNITISWGQDVEVDRIEIFDLSGRLVKSRNVSVARNFVMEVNDLRNGMYLLNIVSGALNSRQKFMKLDKL